MVNTQNKASTMTATKESAKGTVVVEGHSFPVETDIPYTAKRKKAV